MEAAGLIIVALYFLPALIAAARSHHNATAIALLNLFLGWTFAGWVIALVWSFTNSTAPALSSSSGKLPALKIETPKTCQWCMALNSRAFRRCSECGRPLPR